MVNIVTYAVGMVATLAALASAQAPSASTPVAASSAAAAPATSSSGSSPKYNLQNTGGKVLSGAVNGNDSLEL